MKRVRMIANKMFTYGTRRLRAGDVFEPTREDARVLVAVGLARQDFGTAPQPVPPVKPVERPPVPPIVETPLAELRFQYEVKMGRKPDMRWGVARLRAELDEV